MRTYGSLSFLKKGDQMGWVIKAPPHILLRTKRIFGRMDKDSFGKVFIFHSPEVCRDLEWFIDRYPLDVSHPKLLKTGAELHRQKLAYLEAIVLPDYKATPRRMRKPLRDYQARMVDIFLQQGHLLCADTLGLGKTVEALGCLTDPEMRPALVVCKSHLQDQWLAAVGEFLLGGEPTDCISASAEVIGTTKVTTMDRMPDVLIISYNKLWAWCEILADRVKCLIFDEVQELRRSESQKSKAAAYMRTKIPHCLGLSATPIYNYGGEFYNVMDVIAPLALGSRNEFYREWCEGSSDKALIKDPDAFGTYLREQFLMIRRTRAEVGRELPPVLTIVERVDYDVKVLDAIQDSAVALARLVLSGSFHESGEAARMLDMKTRQATGIAKAPFVITFVRMLLGEGPILLAGWHREVYEIWTAELKKWNVPFVMYTGSETTKEKTKAKAAFMAGEVPVMIISLRSGEGLDGLQQVCNTVVFGEMDWSPGVHEQVRGRLFRDGQTKNVSEIFLVSSGGSDPVIAQVLGLKKAQVTGLLEPGTKGLKKLQTDANRIKRLAEHYLKHQPAVEVDPDGPAEPLVGETRIVAALIPQLRCKQPESLQKV
jgi:hypothetical protein